MSFHIPSRPPAANQVELQNAGLTALGSLVQSFKCRPIFVRNQWKNALILYIVQRVGLNHLQTCSIHHSQDTARTQHFHTFRFGVVDRLEESLPLNDLFLCLL